MTSAYFEWKIEPFLEFSTVAPASAIRNTQYAIRTNISTFSELYAGLLSAQQARTMGRLEGDDAACAALSAAFAAAPLHMWPADWF